MESVAICNSRVYVWVTSDRIVSDYVTASDSTIICPIVTVPLVSLTLHEYSHDACIPATQTSPHLAGFCMISGSTTLFHDCDIGI
jgi:hypothetical protein